MNCNKSFFGLFLALLVVLPGCMKVPTYRKQSLGLIRENYESQNIHNDIIVHAKHLTYEELYSLFGVRAKRLARSVEVVYVSICNVSSHNYIFSVACNTFTPLPYADVVKLMKTSTVGRCATGIVGGAGISAAANGLFVTGVMAILQPPSAIWIPYALVFGIPIAFVIGALPFCGKSVKSAIMNRRIKKDLREKLLPDNLVINSGDQCEGLIFVKASDYTPKFNVTMHEKGNTKNSVTFDVDLRKVE